MKFSEYISTHIERYTGLSAEQAYDSAIENILGDSEIHSHPEKLILLHKWLTEKEWHRGRRPYYKVWPSIFESLLRLRLDIPCNAFPKVFEPIAVRFAECIPWNYPLLISIGNNYEFAGITLFHSEPTLLIFASEGTHGSSIYLPLESDETIESFISKKDSKKCRDTLKIALSIMLLANDPSIIEPDVLSKDEPLYRLTHCRKYVEKAHRRGKIGYHIGKSFEAIPCWRRPHPMLAWTGQGRLIPKIVLRRGNFANYRKITTVPTGYMTPDGREMEEVI